MTEAPGQRISGTQGCTTERSDNLCRYGNVSMQFVPWKDVGRSVSRVCYVGDFGSPRHSSIADAAAASDSESISSGYQPRGAAEFHQCKSAQRRLGGDSAVQTHDDDYRHSTAPSAMTRTALGAPLSSALDAGEAFCHNRADMLEQIETLERLLDEAAAAEGVI